MRRGTGPETRPAASPAEIAELLGKLGHEDFKTREAATEKLIALGDKAVRPPLEAKAKERGLDPEVASRIEHILDRLCPKEGKTVTDRATGITVSVIGGGGMVEAKDSATGKLLWQTKVTWGKAAAVRIEGDKVHVEPIGWVIVLKTGKLWIGGDMTPKDAIRLRAAAAKLEAPKKALEEARAKERAAQEAALRAAGERD